VFTVFLATFSVLPTFEYIDLSVFFLGSKLPKTCLGGFIKILFLLCCVEPSDLTENFTFLMVSISYNTDEPVNKSLLMDIEKSLILFLLLSNI